MFDELNVHASRIDKVQVQPLISAIFEIADDVYREEDCEGGGFSIGNNYLRIHWFIRKLTFEGCEPDERSRMFLAACQNAQVGWLVDFTSSAVADIFPREGREPEPSEKCLVTAARISEVKALAIKAIKSAAENGRLISHPRLPYILFRWREFAGDDSVGVKAWTGEQLRSDEAASMLAKAFTGQSWSQGMGMFGLGDRVAMRNVRASVNGLDHVIDVKEFRRRLEEIENSDALESRYKGSVSIFLEAWRKQEAGDEH